MKLNFHNTIFNLIFFVFTNLIISYILKALNIKQEYLLMLLDFTIVLSLFYLFGKSYFRANIKDKVLLKELITISISGSFILALYLYVYLDIINPDEIKQMLTSSENEMKEQGLSPIQIQQAMSLSKGFMSPIAMSIFSFLGYSFSTLISTFIVANYFKKK